MTDDSRLFDRMAGELGSSLVSDVLDDLGHRRHHLAADLRSTSPDTVLVGRANPWVVEEVDAPPDEPYGGEIDALDSIRPDEVVLVAAGGTTRAALWGELFSTAARTRGARGVVIDGPVRDWRLIAEMGHPLFARGTLSLDAGGRTSVRGHHRRAVVCGLPVEAGDVVVADVDGIVVIPADLLDETVSRAFDKLAKESGVRELIAGGATVREAYDKYGVL